jgi:hypothetical protein
MNREVHVLVLREPQGEIPWGYSPEQTIQKTSVVEAVEITADLNFGGP